MSMLPPFANAAHCLMMNINMNWPIPCRRHEAETDSMGEVLLDTASQESMTLVPSSMSSKDTVFRTGSLGLCVFICCLRTHAMI
jgi:hypothetical protein